ncbi:SLBB domain-containing protein [Moritella viscosa]|uniref:Polysaccharide export protein n=1 Tax=Moritella viscosa TaxID=80854 RepID=A0ABY1HI02_9GAMM|nr:SLBB domain-containing protein [Moritella viscosa]SGY99828.1 Polysaccharide export protein [Moritella viscosa]SGZ14956.1 Polysaccharide export protein [Moritella viscosa]SHO28011.1 Polysaccharide export protein [Moritella viscosa]
MKIVLFCFALLFTSSIAFGENKFIDSGDQLFIFMSGEEDFEKPFQVDASGFIQLPEVGKVHVKGKTLTVVLEELKQSLSVVFRDISKLYIEFRAREKLITVLGYVNDPREVVLPELGNVQMALNKAGGMLAGAQLDNMQLQRGAEVIIFNFKRYLETGDDNELPALKSGDIIFVPSSPLTGNVQMTFDARSLKQGGDASDTQKAVTVFGEVNAPGTFSYVPDMTIIESLMKANGVTRYANVGKIRVMGSKAPQTFDLKLYLDTGDMSKLPKINPGTTIFVPIQVEDIKVGLQVVYVMGQVNKPGAFEGRKGITFMDMLANAGGPNRYADTQQIRVLKENGETFRFDLKKYSDDPENNPFPVIEGGDVIFLPEKADMIEKSWLVEAHDEAIKIIGAVKNPGRYQWDDDMTFLDLLGHAEGPTEKADLSKVMIIGNDGLGERLFFDLEQFMKVGGDYLILPQLSAGDTVMFTELPDDPTDNKSKWIKQESESSIYILGEVGAPGRYAFNSQLDFLDLLSAADGPTNNADIKHIKVTHRNKRYAKSSTLDLDMYFETGDESLLPQVLPGDTIYIPAKSEQGELNNTVNIVQVLGAVHNPGRYKYDSSLDVVGILTMAGGPTTEAYIDRIVILTKRGEMKHSARIFNMKHYLTQPDYRDIPIIHAGDTIYIPNEKESNWSQLLDILGSALSVVTLFIVGSSL